jgi:type I restriction enzyme S subunit
MPPYDNLRPRPEIAWAPSLPSHWPLRKAKRIFRQESRPTRDDDGVVTAFRDGEVTLRTNRRTQGFTEAISETGYQGIREGDLVIHSMDAFAGAIGVSDSDGKSSPVYAACTPLNKREVDVHFYKHLLRHMAASGYIASLAKGIRERSTDFRFSRFAEEELPVPPLDEQRAIAAYLDAQTRTLDAYLDAKRATLDTLADLRAAAIDRAVTRGLDPDAPTAPSGVEWLGEIPAHWDCVKLKYVTSEVKDGLHTTPPKVPEGIPFISTQHVRHQRVDFESATYISEDDYKEGHPNVAPMPGDVLVTLVGSIGFSAVVEQEHVPFSCTRHVGYVRPTPDMLPEYLSAYFESASFGVFADLNVSQTAQPSIYLTSLSNHRIPLPPLAEQRAIVAQVEATLGRIAAAEAEARAAVDVAARYRTALVAEVVTGQADVRRAAGVQHGKRWAAWRAGAKAAQRDRIDALLGLEDASPG